MSEILGGLNYTAIIMTVMICTTTLKTMEHLRVLSKTWLEGLRTELEIQRTIHRKH